MTITSSDRNVRLGENTVMSIDRLAWSEWANYVEDQMDKISNEDGTAVCFDEIAAGSSVMWIEQWKNIRRRLVPRYGLKWDTGTRRWTV